MNERLRRAVRVLVAAALGLPLPAAAQQLGVPRVGLTTSLTGASGAAATAAAARGGYLGGNAALAALSAPAASVSWTMMPQAAPSAAALAAAAPSAAFSAAAPAALAAEAVPAAAAPSAAVSASQSFAALSAASARDGRQSFDGSRASARAAFTAAAPRTERGPSGFIKNADGVWVGGRVAEQALWINKMHAQLSGTLDLSDVMDVMDDAYDEARVKLRSAESAAADHKLDASSVHLEGTRNWVDAVLTDKAGNAIAVHTHRVYFHPAPGNPASEIAEGIRRATKYMDKAKADFGPGGLAENEMDRAFSEVNLYFDVRGYKEIEAALREKAKEFDGRFKFHFVNEPRMASAPLRKEYNRLVEQYRTQPEGLMNILDGVTYSREVGVGHELNSHLKRMAMGLKITQAGRDFFGKKVLPDGRIVEEYKTEFDAVTERADAAGKPLAQRDVTLWEDKSARVWMPLDQVMEDTFLYKLRIYRQNRALIEESLGAPLKVAFSVDVGGTNRRAAKQGILVWQDIRQKELMEHLQANEAALSAEYGFPVSFIFVNSHPGENPDLFYQAPMDEAQWKASQGGGRSERKHGRRR